jgi:hypothetical protein
MRMKSYTDIMIEELERTLTKAKAYRAYPGDRYHSQTHATLKRATLDLTQVLAQWRKEPPHIHGAK